MMALLLLLMVHLLVLVESVAEGRPVLVVAREHSGKLKSKHFPHIPQLKVLCFSNLEAASLRLSGLT